MIIFTLLCIFTQNMLSKDMLTFLRTSYFANFKEMLSKYSNLLVIDAKKKQMGNSLKS